MRKVLLVTYHFPPDAAMGALRPAQFAKYLPAFGWEPVVLTVAEGYYPIRDASPAPAGSVRPLLFRSRMFGTPRYYLLKLKHLFAGAKAAFPSHGPTATSHTQRLGARLRRGPGRPPGISSAPVACGQGLRPRGALHLDQW